MPARTDQTLRGCRPRQRSPRGGRGGAQGAVGPAAHDARPGSWGPLRWGALRPGVRFTGGAGTEEREDLVDHRRLGDERDDPHRPATRRTRERVHGLRARRRPVRLVGPIRHGLRGSVGGAPLERDGIPGAVAREVRRERALVLGDPDGRVHAESGMRPGEHVSGLVLVEQIKAYEEAEHGAAKRLRQPRRVVHGPRHQGSGRPESAVSREEVGLRMRVGPRAMRLQTGDDADGKVRLAGQRANGGGDGAGGDADDLAEQAAIAAIGEQICVRAVVAG